MNCPACQQPLVPGERRCGACGAVVDPPSEGALAPDPRLLTPPARSKVEPLREIPGLRKRERTWKDEVRDRVRDRRRTRTSDRELPLFRDMETAEPEASPPEAEVIDEPLDQRPLDLGSAPSAEQSRESVARPSSDESFRELDAIVESARRGAPTPLEEEDPWTLAPASDEPVRPVERPATLGDRLQAGALDALLLGAIDVLVVYFASRVAHVSVAGLKPSWPYLIAYLLSLGLAYAAYFTGTTGQTLGKLVSGLRVVDTSGRPPGSVRASLRAAVGFVGIALVGAALLPVFFDPAKRTLHDRILKTRVVKT